MFLLATEGETLRGVGAEELRLQRLDTSSMRTLLVARTHDVLAPGATAGTPGRSWQPVDHARTRGHAGRERRRH